MPKSESNRDLLVLSALFTALWLRLTPITLQYLMHFEELNNDFALVVERSPAALSSELPPSIAKKQFGV